MKHSKLIAIIMLVALIGLILSCDKTNTGPGDESTPFVYPHSDGAEWIYSYEGEYKDLWQHKQVLNGTYTHQYIGEVQNIQRYQLSPYIEEWQRLDDNYLVVTDEEVRCYRTLDVDDYEILIKFPLEVGKTWAYDPVNHPDWKSTVLAIEEKTVPAGKYPNCYKIEYYSYIEHWGEATNCVWFAHGIGGIYGVSDEYYSLESYSFPSK